MKLIGIAGTIAISAVFYCIGVGASSEKAMAQDWVNHNPAAALLVQEGNALKDNGSIQEAEALYRRAIQQHPEYANGYRVLGLFVNYYFQNDRQEALQHYTKFRDLCQAQNLSCVDYAESLMERVRN